MLSVQKLFDDLDYWIFLGIGNDIVRLPGHRKEYQHLVKKYEMFDADAIPIYVLQELKFELKKPWYSRGTFWRLLWLRLFK